MPCAMPCQTPSRWRAVAHRRVHLDQRAEPRIVVGAQRQMMRRRLAGRDILVLFEEQRSPRPSRCAGHGCGRGPRARCAPAARCSASAAISSRQTGCEDGSPSTRSPRRSRSRNSSSEWKAARRRVFLQDRGDALVVLDQQVAGRRAHEHLDAGRARQPLQFADIAGILARAADPEGEVAMHAAGGAPHLVGKRGLAGGQRIGVGHFEDGGDAAQHGRARAGLQIFLVLQPRLAEMHLAVDDAGQDVQAAAVDRLAGGGLARDRRSRRCGRPLTPMSRAPSPSWLTTVPPVRMRS